MPKEPSPKLTLWMPPNEECPDTWTPCYEDVKEDIVLKIIQEQVAKGIGRAIGLRNLKWDLIIEPVKAEIITPFNVYQFEWPAEDWPCLHQFLGRIRSGLSDAFYTERDSLTDFIRGEIDMENIGRRAWNTFVLPQLQDIRRNERSIGAETAKEEMLSGLLGLERGERTRGQLARIARHRISRWDSSSFKSLILSARELLKEMKT